MNADYLEPKSGTVAGTLASGVHVGDDHVFDFVVQEMTGAEEDLLAGKGNLMARLNQVIINCTVSIGPLVERAAIAEVVRRLTAVDRMILLISLRRASLGDDYRVKYSCPACQASNNASVNLAGLEVTQATTGANTHETTLASGRVVKWHTMTGIDEDWLQEQQKRQDKTGRADILTLAMLTRVDMVDGEALNRARDLNGALKALKALRLSERNELRAIFQSSEGAIDTEVEYACSTCGHEFSADLDVGQAGFFFPSGV